MARRFTHDADRFLGAKNSGTIEHMYSYLRLDRLKRCSISVYVDNLPYELDEVWLCQIFRGYGDVVDVYIPNKRSFRYNTKFGFIRFLSMEEALRAIQDLNRILIRDFHIQVNLAKFSQSNRYLNTFCKSADFVASKGNPAASDFQVISNKRKESNGDFSRSFADVVTGKCSSIINLSVKATEEGNPWLSRSVVAKLPSMRSLESLREAFIAEGVWNIQIRSMGGKLILLTFSSVEDMNLMLEGGDLCWLYNWFDEVKKWELEPMSDLSREVWLNCYGVPLNIWNAETFFSIGRNWSEIITLDDATSVGSSFSVGKVKISTKTFESINQVVDLLINDKVFPIRVVEEPVVANGYMNMTCHCKDRSSAETDSPSSSEEQSDSEKGDNVGDALMVCNKGVSFDMPQKDLIGETIALREDVESNNLSLPFEVVEPNEAILGAATAHVDDDHHSQDPENVLLVEYQTVEESDDINSVDSSLKVNSVVSNSFVEDSNSPLGNIHYAERSIHVQNYKEVNQDEGNIFEDGVANTNSSFDDFTSADLVSADPLINFVDYKRRKKKARTIKGYRRNPVWTKNPLKAAIFSKTFSQEQIEEKSKSLKLGLKKDSFDGHTLSAHEDASSDFRKRIPILIKEARNNMELGASCGIKFFGRESYNIKKFLELKGVDISEKEIIALDDLEEGTSISVEF